MKDSKDEQGNKSLDSMRLHVILREVLFSHSKEKNVSWMQTCCWVQDSSWLPV